MEQKNFSHAEVFGDLQKTHFSAQEAAEYLEIDSDRFVSLVSNGYVSPAEGNSSQFKASVLQACKRRLRAEAAQDTGATGALGVSRETLENYADARMQFYLKKFGGE
jgi:hypothetical protein